MSLADPKVFPTCFLFTFLFSWARTSFAKQILESLLNEFEFCLKLIEFHNQCKLVYMDELYLFKDYE